MKWLAQNRPELIAAEFALNEGGGGRSDGKGNLAIATLHVGEKAAVNYRIEATNPGGHSSAPVRDNAIYELADALARLRAYDFPLQLSDTTRAYFRVAGKARGDAMDGADKGALATADHAEPDTAAAAIALAPFDRHRLLPVGLRPLRLTPGRASCDWRPHPCRRWRNRRTPAR